MIPIAKFEKAKKKYVMTEDTSAYVDNFIDLPITEILANKNLK